jgi:hypothetical protein
VLVPGKFRIVALSAVVLLTFVSSASAHTTIIEPAVSHHPYQRWANRAYVPTPDVTLRVYEGMKGNPCGHVGGCTDLHSIWLPKTDRTDAKFRFFHELGHNFAATTLPWSTRLRLTDLLREPSPWEGGTSESFADSYGVCAVKEHITQWWIEGISERRQRLVCGAIRHAPLGAPREPGVSTAPTAGPVYEPARSPTPPRYN